MKRLRLVLPVFAVVLLGISGCDDKPSTNLAPSATALAPAKPASAGSAAFAIDKAQSKVEFMMEAPQEKIRGRVANAADGSLNVDVSDLTKTTGLIAVDISDIEIFQTPMGEDGKPGPEKKDDKQNEHARAWLEISPDAPEADKKKNAHLEFSITKIAKASESDVTKLTGADRKVTLTAEGDFLLHGHKAKKTVELEATFHFEGDKPTSVSFKTTKPFPVDLAEHDVRPREGFGKLAQKTLEILAPKVAKSAEVSVDFTAKPTGMGGGAMPMKGDGPDKAGDKPTDKPADKPAE